MDGDIETGGESSSGTTNRGTSSIPSVFQGFKLPNDGKLGFFGADTSQKFELSKQYMMESLSKTRSNIRPWTTFFATSRFTVPVVSGTQLPRRIVKNVEYFQSNYLFVFIGLFLYCLVTSPLLLLAVLGSFSVCYWVFMKNLERRVVVFGHHLSLTQQYCLVGLCSMPVLYWVGAGAALFWVLGASCFLIMTHAVFYDVHGLLEPAEESFELTMEEIV